MHHVYLFQQSSPKKAIGSVSPPFELASPSPPVSPLSLSPVSSPLLSSKPIPLDVDIKETKATETKAKPKANRKRAAPVSVFNTVARKSARVTEVLDTEAPIHRDPHELLVLCDAAEFYCLLGEPEDDAFEYVFAL